MQERQGGPNSVGGSVGTRSLGILLSRRPSLNTRGCGEAGGFLGQPNLRRRSALLFDVGGQPNLVQAPQLQHNDNRLRAAWISTADQFFAYLKDGFDVLYTRRGEASRADDGRPDMSISAIPPRCLGTSASS